MLNVDSKMFVCAGESFKDLTRQFLFYFIGDKIKHSMKKLNIFASWTESC